MSEDIPSNLPRPKVQQAPKISKVSPAVRVAPRIGGPVLRILLEENPDIPPSGLYVSHNGNNFQVKAGVWVDAPLPLLEILDHAVTQVPELDPLTKQVIGWREKLRFPYRVAPGQHREAA